MFSLFYEERDRQLKRQEIIDNKLKSLRCSYVINQYLLNEREMNRKLTKEYEATSLYNIPVLIKKQLDITSQELTRVEIVLQQEWPCSFLIKK